MILCAVIELEGSVAVEGLHEGRSFVDGNGLAMEKKKEGLWVLICKN